MSVNEIVWRDKKNVLNECFEYKRIMKVKK